MTASFIDTNSIYNGGHAYFGAAVYCSNCQTMTFTSVTFMNNIALNGGAIAYEYYYSSDTPLYSLAI